MNLSLMIDHIRPSAKNIQKIFFYIITDVDLCYKILTPR